MGWERRPASRATADGRTRATNSALEAVAPTSVLPALVAPLRSSSPIRYLALTFLPEHCWKCCPSSAW